MLVHLYRRAALQELAESIYSNGYFSSEPLIVSGADASGKRTVLEGNRRLATLLILAQDPRATAGDLVFRVDGQAVTHDATAVPAVEVDDPDEFEAYLGFRHISGLRMWGAGEKAAYLWSRVTESAQPEEAFYLVGRQVGSNARGVRSAYIAYELLEFGRGAGIADSLIDFVLSERFGVWTRLLGTRNIASFIELDTSATTRTEVDAAISRVSKRRLESVLSDLHPRPGRSEAVLRDSRQVTDYSDAIGDEAALAVLRASGNLDLAAAVANRPEVDAQIQEMVDRVDILVQSVSDGAAMTGQSQSLADRLLASVRLLKAAVAAFADADADA
ncbi:hypothetical protein [Agrococcus sp. ProA11]|uniref:hypothetical protein n=1 Tax=Agrococcus chionoecetis TaxID=3153752 RepID=UPI00326080F3